MAEDSSRPIKPSGKRPTRASANSPWGQYATKLKAWKQTQSTPSAPGAQTKTAQAAPVAGVETPPEELTGPELQFADGAPGSPVAETPAPPSQESAGVSDVQAPATAAKPSDTVDDTFIKYLHKVEGGERHINSQGQWMPYNTDGAGKWTIGRGHLINGGKNPKGWENGLTTEEVEQLFEEDVIVATEQARKDVGPKAFDALPLKMRQLLVDFSFNLGSSWSKKFPKMTRAVLAGDMVGAYNQMERWKTAPSGAKSKLKGRNRDAAEYFFGKTEQDEAPNASALLDSDGPSWIRPEPSVDVGPRTPEMAIPEAPQYPDPGPDPFG